MARPIHPTLQANWKEIIEDYKADPCVRRIAKKYCVSDNTTRSFLKARGVYKGKDQKPAALSEADIEKKVMYMHSRHVSEKTISKRLSIDIGKTRKIIDKNMEPLIKQAEKDEVHWSSLLGGKHKVEARWSL